MSSTYSTNLALELIGTGDQTGTWGATTNTNLGTLLEQAISGYVTQACTGGTDTLTIPNGASGVARNMYIELTGTGGGTVVVPSNKKLYLIYNNCSSGAVTVKVSGQTGVSVPNLTKMFLVSNGTDVVNALNYFASLSAGSLALTSALPVTSGGTGQSSVTAYNVIVGNNGGTGFSSVAPGTTGNVLTSDGTSWTSAAVSSGVSSFSAGSTGLTPSTGTTGAVTLAGTLVAGNGGTGLTSVGTSGNVLTSDGSAWTSAAPASRVTLATPQSSTSGTAINFTGIPSGVKRITVMFTGVSTTGTGSGNVCLLLQIGSSGGIETSGYISSASVTDGATLNSTSTSGFLLEPVNNASTTSSGAIDLYLANSSSYSWVSMGVLGDSSGLSKMSGGSKSLSATIDRIRITTVGGTDTFDAGEINIQYEI
jgi:hypothetical protein